MTVIKKNVNREYEKLREGAEDVHFTNISNHLSENYNQNAKYSQMMPRRKHSEENTLELSTRAVQISTKINKEEQLQEGMMNKYTEGPNGDHSQGEQQQFNK